MHGHRKVPRPVYCHVFRGVSLLTGFGLVNGFIDHLQAVTTNNHTTTADFHTSHSKSSQSAFTRRFLVTDINNEDSPASVPTSLLSGEYPATELSQPALGRTR
jgi:hypothetical protein